RDRPVQHVRQQAGHGDRRGVGGDERPAQPLAEDHQHADVHHRGHERHGGEPPEAPGHRGVKPAPSPAGPPGGRGIAGDGRFGRNLNLPRRARSSRPATPSPVSAYEIHSTGVRPYRNSTCVSVGTTTMKLGATRYGPSAPSTRQFGKYDIFTSTGLPTRSTSNETLSSSTTTSLTSAGSTRRSRARSCESTRCQPSGPSTASGTDQRAGPLNQRTAGPPQRPDPSGG